MVSIMSCKDSEMFFGTGGFEQEDRDFDKDDIDDKLSKAKSLNEAIKIAWSM